MPLRVRRALVYAALGYVVLNAAVMVLLFAAALNTRTQWQRLMSLAQGRMPSAVSVGAMEQEMDDLRKRAHETLSQLHAGVALHQQRFVVGGKLAALTRTLPGRTWITSLSGAREGRSLTVQAAYLIDPNKPYDLPTKGWIEALRADPSFGEGLKRLDLGTSSRKMQGSAELFCFELNAEWQPS